MGRNTGPEQDAYDWAGRSGDNLVITFQGQLFTWKVGQPPRHFDPKSERGIVSSFSRWSRMRMLKLVATIDWQKAGECRFITLTYPDECGKQTRKQLNQARAVFWRSVENLMDKHVCCLWRLEWKLRLSGVFEGEWMPHWHLIAFDMPRIDKYTVRRFWQQAIQSPILPRTKVQKMKSERQVGYYVSKYAAKTDDTVLVNGAKHNTYTGRLWGVLRKELLPQCPKQEKRVRRSDHVDALREAILKHWPEKLDAPIEGFTLFGPLAVMAGKKFFDFDFDPDCSFG